MSDPRTVHLGAHSVRDLKLFYTPEDYAIFKRITGWALRKHDLKAGAYHFMPTHYHFELKDLPQSTQTAFLRDLNQTYAEEFNRIRRASGSVFEPRTWVYERRGKGTQLFVKWYIEANAFKSGAVSSLALDPYSSYAETMNLRPRPDWLEPEWFLRTLSPDPEEALLLYEDYAARLCKAVPRKRRTPSDSPYGPADLPLTLDRILERKLVAAALPRGIRPHDARIFAMRQILPVRDGQMAGVIRKPRSTVGRRRRRLEKLFRGDAGLQASLEEMIDLILSS